MPTRLVALLRGVNVGRNKRIAMAQLRDLLAGLGHTGVATYLQSGNALFSSASADTAAVAAGIAQAGGRELAPHSQYPSQHLQARMHSVPGSPTPGRA